MNIAALELFTPTPDPDEPPTVVEVIIILFLAAMLGVLCLPWWLSLLH